MALTIGPGWQFLSNPAGSILLNGSNQYLSATSAAMPPTLGTSVFTIEMWVNFAAFPTAGQFANFCNQQGDFRFFIYNDLTISGWQGSTTLWTTAATGISLNTWYHICIMRSDATTCNIYVNGVQQTKTLNTTTVVTYTSTGMLVGGESGNYRLNGRITNFRMVVGTAVYTVAGFTPPTAPLTNIANTKLLLLATDAGTFANDSSTANAGAPYTVVNNNGATFSYTTPFSTWTATS